MNTPSGTPAAANASANTVADDGVSSDGFTTTALPHANAGATFHVNNNSGRFHGTTTATTPTGLRTA